MINKKLTTFLAIVLLGFGVYLINENANKNSIYKPRNNNALPSYGIKGAIDYLNQIKSDQLKGYIDYNDVINARESVNLFAKNNKQKSLGINWQEMGPDNIGGRCRAILIDKDNTNLIFAGGVAGGLFKSTNAGLTWTKVNTNDNNIPVSCITQDKNGVIYVGTGEGLVGSIVSGINYSTTGPLGVGIYVSNDRGNSFSVLTSTIPTTTSSEWITVNELAVSPITNRLFAATNKGLRFSDDAGNTWATPFTATLMASDIAIASDGMVVASVGGRCWISPTGATGTFTNVSTTGKLPSSGIGRIELAIPKSNSNIIYASVVKTDGYIDNIYMSEDKGNSWTVIGSGGHSSFQPFSNQGVYDNALHVKHDNPKSILLGGIDIWKWDDTRQFESVTYGFYSATDKRYVHSDIHTFVNHPSKPEIIYVGTDGGISQSSDNGATYKTLNKNFNVTQFYTLSTSYWGAVMGGTQDNGTIMINPQQTTNTPMTGISVSGGDGGHCEFSILDHDVYFTSIYFGASYRTADFGANRSKLEDFYSSEMLKYGGATIKPGDMSFPASFITPILLKEKINDTNSIDTIVVVADESYKAGTEYTFFSANRSFPIKVTLSKNVNKGDTLKQQDVVQARYYVGFAGAVFMTKDALKFDGNLAWFKIAGFSEYRIHKMAISNDGNVLYFATDGGNLYRISNLNKANDSLTADIRSDKCVLDFNKITVPFSGRAITSLYFDPRDDNNLLITLGNYNQPSYIYVTENALDSIPEFKSKQGNLPKVPVFSGIIEMKSTTAVIGTEYGAYSTSNIFANNVNWAEENTGMGRVPIFAAKQQTVKGALNYGVIYLATHGRGIFKTDQYQITSVEEKNINKTNSKAFRIYPNPMRDNANISFTSENRTSVILNVYDIRGQLIDKVEYKNCISGMNNIRYTNNNLKSGTYIVRLSGEGVNYSSKIIVNNK